MNQVNYEARRGEIETYFDQTAVEAWNRLTSDAPVSRIRASVRAGRNKMLGTLSNWLPQDLTGKRVLDAGCGTGLLATELAGRGAQVVAIDLSPTLISLAEERVQAENPAAASRIHFAAGDMLDPSHGEFDYAVAMDSLIHYEPEDMLAAVRSLSERIHERILFTVAPRTALLATMHKAGKLFPKKDRSPSIVPIGIKTLREQLANDASLTLWQLSQDQRVDSGFYKSHAHELVKHPLNSHSPGNHS